MASVVNSGSQLTVINTEHVLDTVTGAGTYVLTADLSVLALGDGFWLRVYGKVLSGGTERLLHSAFYGLTPLASPMVMSVPIISPHHFKATLQQTDGSVRTVDWSIYET